MSSCPIFIWCEIKLLKVRIHFRKVLKKGRKERKKEILEICTWKSESFFCVNSHLRKILLRAILSKGSQMYSHPYDLTEIFPQNFSRFLLVLYPPQDRSTRPHNYRNGRLIFLRDIAGSNATRLVLHQVCSWTWRAGIVERNICKLLGWQSILTKIVPRSGTISWEGILLRYECSKRPICIPGAYNDQRFLALARTVNSAHQSDQFRSHCIESHLWSHRLRIRLI